MVLLDATYKTSRLNLPLFFLVVKTNVGYTCVGSFIVQNEDAGSITEALVKIRRVLDGEGIRINSFMIDKSAAEIKSLKTVFPGVTII